MRQRDFVRVARLAGYEFAGPHTEAVQKGRAWLDENRPEWLKLIQPKKLDLKSSSQCVLGQVYGDFWDALENLNQPKAWAYERGFTPPPYNHEWSDLTEEWLRQIRNPKARYIQFI